MNKKEKGTDGGRGGTKRGGGVVVKRRSGVDNSAASRLFRRQWRHKRQMWQFEVGSRLWTARSCGGAGTRRLLSQESNRYAGAGHATTRFVGRAAAARRAARAAAGRPKTVPLMPLPKRLAAPHLDLLAHRRQVDTIELGGVLLNGLVALRADLLHNGRHLPFTERRLSTSEAVRRCVLAGREVLLRGGRGAAPSRGWT